MSTWEDRERDAFLTSPEGKPPMTDDEVILVHRRAPEMSSSVDPSEVPPDVPWWVRLPDGTECVGVRAWTLTVSGDPWAVVAKNRYRRAADYEVTLLHRLVPEERAPWEVLRSAAGLLDAHPDWPVTTQRLVRDLRATADDVEREHTGDATPPACAVVLPAPDAANPAHLRWAADLIEAESIEHLWPSGDEADEAYGTSAKLKAEARRIEDEVSARSRRDTLTAKAAQVLAGSCYAMDFSDLDEGYRAAFRQYAEALFDAGLLAEADQ